MQKENLEYIIKLTPGYVYWKDLNSRYIGCNQNVAILSGLKTPEEVIGKTDYDMPWGNIPEITKKYIDDDKFVINTGDKIVTEDRVGIKNADGLEIIVRTEKAPLIDENNVIIGILGIAVDITAEKESQRLKLENHEHMIRAQENEKFRDRIGQILRQMPGYVYWKDSNFKYLFCNEAVSHEFLGFSSPSEIIGKTDYDFGTDKKIVDEYRKVDEEILKTGQPKIGIHETIVRANGKIGQFLGNKMPLIDNDGNTIGIIGVTVDITAEREAQRLELENREYIVRAQEHEKFRDDIGRVVHDIGAPVSGIIAIAKNANALPEAQRISLRNAAIRIEDLTKDVLVKYEPNRDKQSDTPDGKVDLLVSAAMNEIMGEKRMQYHKLSVNFEADFSQKGNFAFINIELADFKNMLSNLMNNSVDAFEGKAGKVIIKLDCDDEYVNIVIKDNGKGMSPELISKIMNNISVTEGKKGGHGIGMRQIRDTLQQNGGTFKINSTPGSGTEIIVTFPKIETPSWIAESIKIYADDIVVILDDDPSIHGAWDLRLETDVPNTQVHHFTLGKETIDFINKLSPEDKQKVFLLTDYELLKQGGLNGLQVAEQTQVERSVLVTSHNEGKKVQADAQKTHTRILPKFLVAEIPISFIDVDGNIAKNDAAIGNHQKQVDLVVVDDNVVFIDMLKASVFNNKNVDIYHDLQDFLANVMQYAKNTKILVDNNYDNYKGELRDISVLRTGFSLAKRLHESGFTNLYLFSGTTFKDIPDYLKVVNKSGIDEIEALMASNSEKQEKLDMKQQLWDVIYSFNNCSSYKLKNSAYYDIWDTVYKIKQKPAKMLPRLEQLKKIGENIKDGLEYETSTIAMAKKIFNQKANVRDLHECDFRSNFMEDKLRFILNQNRKLLTSNIKHTFKYMGNVVIVDLILLNLLKYSESQIQQSNSLGNIHMSINKHGKTNKVYIKYELKKINITLPENDNYYANNYEFCKNTMQLFGGNLTANIINDNSVEFVLAFPKIQKAISKPNEK